ncbi:hypothetical protein DOTSEDRAFT_69315 [Dothistroma septosporum NZE10]|uniref:DUF4149 domain-containing protein n=1 Tax=Dothistroma septosporum (strain NZE10 / CBS 128990) TaxID=675120 RepID=N1PVE5_DOTSN|nr:hypothetical protein DOTSEDRAFT_69315 [Dothistroma septosporum NZE10]
MAVVTQAIQTLSVSISLLAAGGIAGLSLFDVPELQSQPAARALPQIRWLFSRGSHIFPQAAIASALGFAYLAYDALPSNLRSLSQLLKTTNGLKVNGFLAAALLAFSIGPYTQRIMLGNNFALIKKNEDLGGSRSVNSAAEKQRQGVKAGQYSAEDSVNSKQPQNELRDLSGPMEKTEKDSSEFDDKEVKERLATFGQQNMVRAVLLGAGGIVGLFAALA